MNYRPIRRVISLPSADLLWFRLALEFCTRSWGGALNFIAIEVEPGVWERETRRCVGGGQIDLITVAGPDPGSARARRLHDVLPEAVIEGPHIGAKFLDSAPPTGQTFGLILDKYNQLPAGQDLPAFIAAAWGEPFPPSPDGPPVGLGYVGWLLGQWSAHGSSPICQTMNGLARPPLPSGHRIVVIPCGTDDSVRELALFWNIRAALWPFAGAHVGLLPTFDVDLRPSRFRDQLLRPALLGLEPPDRRILLVDTGSDIEGARRTLDAILHDPSEADSASGLLGTGAMDVPVDVGFPDLYLFPYRVSAETSEQLVLRQPGDLVLALAPPISGEGYCAVDVLRAEPRLTLPTLVSVARLVHLDAHVIRDGVAVMIQPSRDRVLELAIPSDRDVCAAVFDDFGITALPSDKARWTDQLLMALGGSLEGFVLRDELTFSALRSLAPEGNARTVAYPELTLSEIKTTLADHLGRVIRREDARRALSALVSARVVFAGVRVHCHSCDLELWRIVDDLTTEMRCAGCRATVRFGASDTRTDLEPEWVYRLNPAFASVIDQGTAAVLIALSALRDYDPGSFRFVTGRRLLNVLPAEIEIDGLASSQGQLLVLEAKSSGTIDQRGIDNTAAAAKALRATACFATPGQWDERSSVLLRQLVPAGPGTGAPPVRILDGSHVLRRPA